MQKSCAKCPQQFSVTEDDLAFYDKISPVFNNKKYPIPPPTLCPDCRQQRRLVQRNESKLYRRKCDYTGQEMISLYSPENPHKVYKEEIWWSDKWNPIDYGQNIDFNKPFFKQIEELQLKVPRRGMHQDGTNENCEYTTFGMSNKNSYMTYACFYCENTYYSFGCGMVRDCVDCHICIDCELCYQCLDCTKCYNCANCQDCISCEDSFFLQDCRNCHHCIGCKNLRNKEYHIYNKPVTKEEFEHCKAAILSDSYISEKEKFEKWKLSLPFVYARINKSENSDGDYLDQAKNCHECYDVMLGAEDSRYCQFVGWKGKDMVDCTTTGKDSEILYEMMATTGSYHSAFNNFCRWVENVYYCGQMSNSKNCFGCIGLNYKEYCILNKQYTREEYLDLVPKIIDHMMKTKEWGEFFPASLSPFGYNETVAQQHFPLTKEQALKNGFTWKDDESKEQGKPNQPALICDQCKKQYRIIPQEQSLYKKMSIPSPTKCHECRYQERISKRNPRHLHPRPCANCQAEIQTTYAPDRPETVYCEKCYLNEVY